MIRYWAASGCLILAQAAVPAREALQQRLGDEWLDVRVVAAEALAQLGEVGPAVKVLGDVLRAGDLHESLAAQNALDALRAAALMPLPQAQALVRDLSLPEPGDRIPRYLLGLR